MTTLVRKTWIDDDGSGTTGTILNNAALQGDIYAPVDAALASVDTKNTSQDSALAALGQPTTIPFVATDFSALGPMVWTVTAGNAGTWLYTRIGGMVILFFDIASTTISGTPTAQLYLKLPVTPARSALYQFWYANPTGGFGIGNLDGTGGGRIALFRDPAFSASWAAGAGNVRVSGQVIYMAAGSLLAGRDEPGSVLPAR